MSKRLLDIDDDALDAARAQLGTGTIEDTVNEALRPAGADRPRDSRSCPRRRFVGGSKRRVALTHLVDTSVLTRVAIPAIRSTLERHMQKATAARAGISDLEIGFSASDADGRDRVREALDSFLLVETNDAHLRRARQVQRMLAQQRLRGRKVPDLLVAAAAEDRGLVVLHYDASGFPRGGSATDELAGRRAYRNARSP